MLCFFLGTVNLLLGRLAGSFCDTSIMNEGSVEMGTPGQGKEPDSCLQTSTLQAEYGHLGSHYWILCECRLGDMEAASRLRRVCRCHLQAAPFRRGGPSATPVPPWLKAC